MYILQRPFLGSNGRLHHIDNGLEGKRFVRSQLTEYLAVQLNVVLGQLVDSLAIGPAVLAKASPDAHNP